MTGGPAARSVRPDAVSVPAPAAPSGRPERGCGSLGAGEFWLVLLGALALAVVMFWPLVLHLSGDVAKDAGDPLLQAWQVSWDGHALLHQLMHFWQSNLLYPNRDSLAFSDALVGYAPAGLIGHGQGAALARYNLLFLLAYALSVAGPYALARELGAGRLGAVVAGVAFAYSPWRWEQSGHLHIISSGTIALCLALLYRGYRLRRPRAVVGGWLVAAWQVLIGVSLGLMLTYLLAVLAVVTGAWWLRAARPAPGRAVLRATAAAVAVYVACLTWVAAPYLRVHADYPESHRTLAEVRLYSPPLKAFWTASADNPIWGGATASVRATLLSVPEQTLFPGAVILVLALAGLVAGRWSRRLRMGLLVAGLLSFAFSLGVHFLGGTITYKLLFEHAPGWDGVRTPGRFHTLTTLVLALLAAAGAQRLVDAVGRRRHAQQDAAVAGAPGTGLPRGSRALAAGPSVLPRDRRALAAAVLAAVLAIAICVEGSAWGIHNGTIAGPSHPRIARAPAGLADARPPLLELPIGTHADFDHMLWTVDGFPKVANGLSGFTPARQVALAIASLAFPNRASVTALRQAGIRTVVVFGAEVAGTPWQDVTGRPVAGLGIRRVVHGDVSLYELAP